MDYTKWSEAHLERLEVELGSHRASVWCTKPAEKPLLVLLHGIGGDHAGLVPLAAELEKTYRVAIVELPGHGDSDPIPLPSAVSLQRWFDEVLLKLEQKIGSVAAVCAHSFGCSAVLSENTIKERTIILLNPVPTPSSMYATYARMIMDSAHFWAHIYNWKPFVMLRNRVLMKTHTRDARRRVRWVSVRSRATPRQIVYHAGLVDIILDGSAYRHAYGGVSLVVCGMFDTTASQRDSLEMEGVFGPIRTVFLKGGHLLPIETPERVARLIRETVVK